MSWFQAHDCDLDEFRALVEVDTEMAAYPHAAEVVSGVLIYRLGHQQLSGVDNRREIQTELARALLDGPGIVVFKGAFDEAVVDAATWAFEELIAKQQAAGAVAGDHFAKPGANDRVWGALDKLAVAHPDVWVDYYGNETLALVSEAWLGPHYQVTSQVNVVNPGGQAQVAHRDYHLGFMDRDQARAYPALVHGLSPALTLQGAVAHVDMPVETGPTLYLPHSQQFPAGYIAFHDPKFTEYFEANYVQLPLEKGDAVFFNPALFHGAGSNHTRDVRRMANLLQISSAFGRAMESVDTTAICQAIYPRLLARVAHDPRGVANAIAAAAEGYAFPTNLDLDTPVGAMAPPSQADLMRTAVAQRWASEDLAAALRSQQQRRTSVVSRP